jgi:hypothetical protein
VQFCHRRIREPNNKKNLALLAKNLLGKSGFLRKRPPFKILVTSMNIKFGMVWQKSAQAVILYFIYHSNIKVYWGDSVIWDGW